MSNQAPQHGRTVAVSLFDGEPVARKAVDQLRASGVEERRVGMLVPSPDSTKAGMDVSGLLAEAGSSGIETVLQRMGVPEGEARFYAHEVQDSGRTLVIVDANDYAATRDVLLRAGGYDVQSRGGELAAADDVGAPSGTGPMPIDITHRWEDVASRYEMLWQQHYGTSDATWEQMAPVYRFAWYAANDARWRGRPWSQAEDTVRRAWQSTSGDSRDWQDVAGPIHDVWEDVAEEALMGAEGGQDRRIPRQGTDQSVAARDLISPSGPPA
jgi:hypothetical protein